MLSRKETIRACSDTGDGQHKLMVYARKKVSPAHVHTHAWCAPSLGSCYSPLQLGCGVTVTSHETKDSHWHCGMV